MLTLNLGCGDRTYDEYPPKSGFKCINFDFRSDLKRVDVVGDVKDLSMFSEDCFDYILASDIIEHFPIFQTKKILTEWRRVLKNRQTIELRMPDLKEICRKYVNNELETKVVSWLIYGGQDYPGNFHYVGFDRDYFLSIALPVGFKEAEYRRADNNFEIKLIKI